VDARKINQVTLPDRTKVAPMQEILQRFHGTQYITTLDLSSACLQVPLEEASRKYTDFEFHSNAYQYQRIPYGFRNSLAGFIRALQTVLGDETCSYVIIYVDDILIFSRSFDQHMDHLDTVLNKLTSAGFTINVRKCSVCKQEITFLGHIVSKKKLMPDPQRIETMLNYPAPRNQKQLRRFLGVCGFHQRFIINYTSYVAPLLVLLQKQSKWKLSTELQLAFEAPRERFAYNIHLIHPDDDLPYIIHTDANGKVIAGVLMQATEDGETRIVSTASRVLSLAEQRYSTCEQELLAIVYALQKFRIYIFGHRIMLYTDKKSLSFLHKCVFTSNKVARWVVELQQYDIQVRHITGTNKHLADVLSRNPAGLTENEFRDLRKQLTL